MKKALLSISTIVTSLMLASAQTFQLTTSGSNGNGGTIIIGQQSLANSQVGGSLINLISLIQNIVARLVPLGIGLAVVALFFGVVMFMITSRNAEGKARESWLKWMGYSILGLFVMVAIWGLVGFLASVLGVGVGGSVPVPSIPVAQ